MQLAHYAWMTLAALASSRVSTPAATAACEPGFEIRGTVFGAGCAPLRRFGSEFHESPVVRVTRLRDAQGEPLPSESWRVVRVDAEGGFVVTRLQAGTWQCVAVAPAYQGMSTTVTLTGAHPVAHADFELERREILETRIELDVDRPWDDPYISNALRYPSEMNGWTELRLFEHRSPEFVDPIATGRDSPRELHELFLRPPNWESVTPRMGVLTQYHELGQTGATHISLAHGRRVIETRKLQDTSSPLVFQLSLRALFDRFSRLRVRVVDAETRRPLSQAQAALSYEGFVVSRDPNRAPKIPIDGAFTWERIQPGELGIDIHVPGYERWQSVIDVEPGSSIDLGDIALGRAATIRGMFLDERGRPKRLEFEYDAPARRWAASRSFGKLTDSTGSDGRFFLEDLARAEYVIVPVDRHQKVVHAPVPVSTIAGSIDGLCLSVDDPTRVNLRIARMTHERVVLCLATRAGIPLLLNEIDTREDSWTWTHRGGGSRTVQWFLAPGAYSLSVEWEGALVHTRDFEVGEDPLELELEL